MATLHPHLSVSIPNTCVVAEVKKTLYAIAEGKDVGVDINGRDKYSRTGLCGCNSKAVV